MAAAAIIAVLIGSVVLWAFLIARAIRRPDASGESSFVEYSSFEFAGVRGPRRLILQRARERLLSSLSRREPGATPHLYNMVVLSEELCERYVRHLKTLRFSEEASGIVALRDGRRFLCTVANGIFVTDVEDYPDGIPFGLEEIDRIEPTIHWVSLATMRARSNALKDCGLQDRMIDGPPLAPGNY